jgi:fatty acid desaturase
LLLITSGLRRKLDMKKGNSTFYFILAIIWFVASIIWIFGARYVLGILWLCTAGIYLLTAITMRKKEKDNT